MKVIFSIDAETIGLYGEPFAVAFTILDLHGIELETRYMACPASAARGLDSNREWVHQHVLPILPQEVQYKDPLELCEAVYVEWMLIKKKYSEVIAIADCHYPVETNLFARMIAIDEENRQFTAPFPFHEIETALWLAGINRLQYPRNKSECPEHHPLNDARYSARLFLMALDKTKSNGGCS